jgi:hypothetical protein
VTFFRHPAEARAILGFSSSLSSSPMLDVNSRRSVENGTVTYDTRQKTHLTRRKTHKTQPKKPISNAQNPFLMPQKLFLDSNLKP